MIIIPTLGLAVGLAIKLEKKLILTKNSPSEASSPSKPTEPNYESEELSEEDYETCSIWVRPIPIYIPRYSNGLQWNPACSIVRIQVLMMKMMKLLDRLQ